MNAQERAALLREQFDRGFAEPVRVDDEAQQDCLAVDAGGAALLLPLGDVAGVATDRTIVAIPAVRAGFLGLIAHAGATVPVYDLAGLLGQAEGMRRTARHLVFARGATVAFAVDGIAGRRRVSAADPRMSQHLHTFWHEDRPITLVRLPAVVAALAGIPASAQEEER